MSGQLAAARVSRAFLFVPVFFGFGPVASVWAPTESGRLEDARASGTFAARISGTIDAGQSSTHRIDVPHGGMFAVEVRSPGLDLILLVSPHEQPSMKIDNPLLRDESERVLVAMNVAGPVDIELTSKEYTGTNSAYTIDVHELLAQGEAELRRIEALRLMTTSDRANAGDAPDDRPGSAKRYGDAADIYRQLNDTAAQARATYLLAMWLYWQDLDSRAAAVAAKEAAALYETLGMRALYANAVQLQAAAMIEVANAIPKSETRIGVAADAKLIFDDAIELFDKAYAVQLELGNRYDVAQILNNIGLTYHYQSEWSLAAQRYVQAAEMFRELDEWAAELNPRANLSVIDFERGELRSAMTEFTRLLEILPPGKEQSFRADTLDNLAAAQLELADIDGALKNFSSALELHKSLDNHTGIGRSLSGIGTTYNSVGRADLALNYLENALVARRRANDGRGQVATLRHLGNIHRLNRDFDVALKHHRQALDLATGSADRAQVLLSLGRDYADSGDHVTALVYLDDAYDNALDAAGARVVADILLSRGLSFARERLFDRASVDLDRALATYSALGLEIGQAEAMLGLALVARDSGRIKAAIDYAERSLDSLERARGRFASPDMRAAFLSVRQYHYETSIDLLMQASGSSPEAGQAKAYMTRAFEISERSRARALTDLINEANIRVESVTDDELPLRRDELYTRLAEKRYQRDREIAAHRPPAVFPTPGMKQIAGELDAIETEINLLESELRAANQRYASLTTPSTLSGSEIQARLGSDTTLLQFALGDAQSYLWVVTDKTIEARRLPGRGTISGAARGVYDGLSEAGLTSQARQRSATDLASLSKMLLGPLATALTSSRIIVVADGALQYLPFGVLPVEDRAGNAQPLLTRAQILSAPSMSVLAAQEAVLAERKAPSKTLALFADPVFSANDPRLRNALEPSDTVRDDSPNSPGGLAAQADLGLSRLPYSGMEAEKISALVPKDQRHVATGLNAVKSGVVGDSLKDYRLVHFATHGTIDTRYPSLSAIALSNFGTDGRQQNGVLRLHDIYKMSLNADLAVLSACDTALGRDIRGEGLVGLTQGFINAGARGVVASLWRVPDRATAELMARFYDHLINGGLSAPAALREAQLSIAAERRWRDPYYWGAFVFHGQIQ